MGRYKVTGTHAVAGVEPGGTVELDEAAVNVAALVRAGHVEPVPAARPKPRPARGAAADADEEG